ncbi:AAA family ATPase [Photobacterium kishitanii]|uniref:AAA family ATPase n=1 Tax=Photobacterium kishitanii TaxID=318456 RepID=UPI00071AED57|nr:ATP-binding protein [Photobacterium kishitanii]
MNKLTNNIDKIALFDGTIFPENWELTNLKQINCFIGPNNSGKSRKIRELFTSDIKQWIIDTYSLPLFDILTRAKEEISRAHPSHVINQQILTVDIEKLKAGINNTIEKNLPIGIYDLGKYLYSKSKNNHNYNSTEEMNLTDLIITNPNLPYSDDFQVANEFKSINWSSCYIPTIRSLRNLCHQNDSTTDLFKERTTLDYFDKNNKLGLIFTGHSLYQDLVKHLLGTHEQRQKVREYEKYLSTNFFFGQDISLVPMVDKDVVYFKEGDKPERPIYDLGDGIQSIIILTFPIFMAENPTMFFIEEPEHFLHAGLQRTLIEVFSLHEQHMFFLTTHSNHILDIAQEREDISIQHVHQKDQETIVQPTKEYGDLLDSLGVRASSVLLANCSVWVEGITDKLYLRTYLKKYIDELKEKGDLDKVKQLNSYHENLHYVFTEYQGSNITHWAFNSEGSDTKTPAKRLNKNILLIADADIDGKGDRVNELKETLGEGFYLLTWKEIENYIPYDILIKTAKQRWNTFNQNTDCSIDRFCNIEQIRFEKDKEGIGQILELYVDKPTKLERKFYRDKSGTIKDKVKFCHTAIKVMSENNWKLTPQLNELCKKIWDHIEEHNK